MSAKKRVVIPSKEEMARYGGVASADQASSTDAPASEAEALAQEGTPVAAAMAQPGAAGPPARAEDAVPAAEGQARSEAQEWKDKYLRAKAELVNYQRRSQRDQEEALRYASASMVKKLLPILDDLERVIASATNQGKVETETVLNGLKLTLENFQKVLEECQVRRIEAQGQPFDPQVHEAVMEQPSADYPHRTVLQELAKGYRLHDRVLRPVKVIVSKGTEQPVSEAGLAGGDTSAGEES